MNFLKPQKAIFKECVKLGFAIPAGPLLFCDYFRQHTYIKMHPLLAKGPFMYYVSKEGGGVRKWQFLLIYSTIYADVGGWVGLKKPKTC